MKKLLYAQLLFCCVAIISCKQKPVGQAPNMRKIKTILILGNSITETPPFPQWGWNNRWGMAASALDSDYVHQLTKLIHLNDTSVSIRFKVIADWERTYQTYDMTKFDSLKTPDMLILRIAENVPDANVKQNNFSEYYSKLISRIDPQNRSVKIITGSFWDKPKVNQIIKDYAGKNGLPFIELTDLGHDPSNKALGKFPDRLVCEHPSDKGMRLIAQRIWGSIRVYFK